MSWYHRVQMWISGKLTVFLCEHQLLILLTRNCSKSRKVCNLNYRILISTSYFTASWIGTTRQTGGVSACKGFRCNSVKLVLLANGNRYEVDSNTFFLSGKALYPRGERAAGRRPRTGAGGFYHPGPWGPQAGSFEPWPSRATGRRPHFHLPAFKDRRPETAYFRPGPGPRKTFFSSTSNMEKSIKVPFFR
jgi:hypothetical protein